MDHLASSIDEFLILLIGLIGIWILFHRFQVSHRSKSHARMRSEIKTDILPYLTSSCDAVPAKLRGIRDYKRRIVLLEVVASYSQLLKGDIKDKLLKFLQEEGYIEQGLKDLSSKQAHTRGSAAKLMGIFKEEKSVEVLHQLALHDRDVGVKITALRSLGLIGTTQAAAALFDLIDKESVPSGVVAQAFLMIGREADKVIVSFMACGTDEIREMACQLAGFRGLSDNSILVSALEKRILADDSVNVRHRAAQSLGLIGRSKSSISLELALNDANVKVVNAALGSIAKLNFVDLRSRVEPLLERPGCARAASYAYVRLGGDRQDTAYLKEAQAWNECING